MAFRKATKQSSRKGSGVEMSAPLLEDGGYPARLIQIFDLGEQKGSAMYPDPKFQLEMRFELLDEFMLDKEGKELEAEPRVLSYIVSYQPDGFMGDRSNIYKVMTALDGFEKELVELLDTPCNVNVVQYKKRKLVNEENPQAPENFGNKITVVGGMREKDRVKAAPSVKEKLFFDMDEPDLSVFEKMPSGRPFTAQEKIKNALNFNGSGIQALLGITPDVATVEVVEEDPEIKDEAPHTNTDEDPFA